MRALLVYESMFGSTSEVARAVREGLTAEGVDVALHEVRSAPAAADADFDLLVVGAPTHAFSLSRPTTRRDAVPRDRLRRSRADPRHGAPLARILNGCSNPLLSTRTSSPTL